MGIAERKQREKDQRVREILTAARELFMSKGYENTTMLNIAEQAELSRRTLYHYFTSKEEISYIIMLESYAKLKEMFRESFDSKHATGLKKLEVIQNTFLEYYKDHFNQFVFTLLLDQKINFMDSPSEDARKCLGILNALTMDIEKTIQMGIDDGSIRKISNPREMAVTILTMIQATMQKIYVRKSWIKASMNVNDDDLIKTMFSLLLSAIRA